MTTATTSVGSDEVMQPPTLTSGINVAGGGGGNLKRLRDMASNLIREDYTFLALKQDHLSRPLWVCEDGKIILEAFAELAAQAQDFLITIAEPVSRPSKIHEFKLTAYSLYAAVSVGMDTDTILAVLDRFSKVRIPDNVKKFIKECTMSYGKAKLVLKDNRYFIETSYPDILAKLLRDPIISRAVIHNSNADDTKIKDLVMGNVTVDKPSGSIKRALERDLDTDDVGELPPDTNSKLEERSSKIRLKAGENGKPAKVGVSNDSSYLTAEEKERLKLEKLKKEDDENFGAVVTVDNDDDIGDDELEDEFTHSFEINKELVEEVKKRCTRIDFPLMEEYDFKHDELTPNLEIDLSPRTMIRDYQEKSLSKMFGGGAGRARSGIIVLPTGAGKTLVGITAACTVKKSILVLCTNALSVEQWANEFRNWSTIPRNRIAKFTADNKRKYVGDAGILVSTYTMISHSGKRSADTQKMIDWIKSVEWGLLILDEVHVVPASMFRRVLTTVAAHTKLGLTATLVREDDKIQDLNFLIGPKLFEANWMDLANRGHIAKVEATEIWCGMTSEFYQEYLNATLAKKRLLCVMNPNKFQACEFLIKRREALGDKIIVFSDNVQALEHYATKMNKPFIYGGTAHIERQNILKLFRQGHESFRTLFLSKVGDTSLDLPEATCLIQISSQFGSRRQEAQRMGRILRAKRRNEVGFRSRFFTLVSKDTDEVQFSAKRKKFLIDQGYSFKVIPTLEELIPEDERKQLAYINKADQVALLDELKLDLKAEDKNVVQEEDDDEEDGDFIDHGDEDDE